MSAFGLFDGLWAGVSNTLSLGAAEISEQTGSADKKRAQELKLAQLNADTLKAKTVANQKIIITALVIILIIAIVLSRKK